MWYLFKLVFIIILTILILIHFIGSGFGTLENFVNPDTYDPLYAKLYDITFNFKTLYNLDSKLINEFLVKEGVEKNAPILEVGSGTGKHYALLHSDYPNLVGMDISTNIIDVAQVNIPEGKFIKGNYLDNSANESQAYKVIITLMETLYYAQDMHELGVQIDNYRKWLKPGGYLIVHIFDPETLNPCPREYSMEYYNEKTVDNPHGKGTLHSLTYFEDFTHDAWWEKIKDSDKHQYCQKFILENGRVMIKNIPLFIPKPNVIIKLITDKGFKLLHVKSLEKAYVDCIKLYMFQLI